MHDIRFYDEVFFVFCCRHSFVLSFFLCNIFFFVLVSLFLVRDFFPSRNEFPSTKYLDQFTLEPTEHFFVIRFSFLLRFCHLSPTHVFFLLFFSWLWEEMEDPCNLNQSMDQRKCIIVYFNKKSIFLRLFLLEISLLKFFQFFCFVCSLFGFTFNL